MSESPTAMRGTGRTAGKIRYELRPLSQEEILQWDALIEPYETREVFHRSAWLEYLRRSRALEIRHWRIQDDTSAGFFCGGILRKGPFRILGSPLRGWGTNYMGPVVNRDFDQAAFLEALDELAKAERLDVIEIENPVLDAGTMAAMGYVAVPQKTYLIPLSEDPQRMWSKIAQRSQVRKAQRAGLMIEDSDDVGIAAEFYEQCAAVLGRKGVNVPFGPAVPRDLYECMKPCGLLFSVRVRDAEGRTIATGLFPHDERTVIYWFGACTNEGYRLAANDLMHWTVMEWAGKRGLQTYDMSGFGFFKSKFGGELTVLNRWYKCYSPMARYGRRAYEIFHQQSLAWTKRWNRWRDRGKGGAR